MWAHGCAAGWGAGAQPEPAHVLRTGVLKKNNCLLRGEGEGGRGGGGRSGAGCSTAIEGDLGGGGVLSQQLLEWYVQVC
jgi:hypothetical protein